MIILVDNKDLMVKFCINAEDCHGFDTTFPCWKGWVRLLSDAGETVMVSGKGAEEFLDESNLFYIHVEDVEGEGLMAFTRRMCSLIEEHEEQLSTSTSYGKLVFAVNADGEMGKVGDDNLLEIWRLNETGRYHIIQSVDEGASKEERVAAALKVEKAIAEELGITETEELTELSDEVDEEIEAGEADFEKLFSDARLSKAFTKALALCELAAA